MHRTLRSFWWLLPPLLPLFASGCALPPALTVASLAVDGASYATTGKSITDHGISAATGHDCALLRPVLSNKPVCDTAGQGNSTPVEDRAAAEARPPVPAATKRYVTIGSFSIRDNAVRSARRFADFKAEVVSIEIKGRLYHRVVAGPLSDEEIEALRARLAS